MRISDWSSDVCSSDLFRNNTDQTALPMRRLGSFLPGTGVGGAGIHWNGQTWRFLPSDFMARSHNEKRYGALPADMTVQDWGVSYDQLEPYYDRFEYRSEERRVGKECVSTFRSRWSQ